MRLFEFNYFSILPSFVLLVAWSMESGEHMPDKFAFLSELSRITMPGGRIIIVTWCHRELNGTALSRAEINLLSNICRAYYLPRWVAGSEYVDLAKRLGLVDVRSADWSTHVLPFWGAVVRSALLPRNIWRLLRGGWTTVKAAVAAVWMMRGLHTGAIRFVIITATKPLN